ncbi:MAG: hypothetical protein II996_02975 [Oscillospiraceae bacterium]|nr:hypothetical protein [Oscillospiraceae bacterium]MBQ4544514.1 hypothetical protein [Oscillospiraceae bacterium]MBQ6902108.1 hypothetical protein [Oscillospiraceae bacterium]
MTAELINETFLSLVTADLYIVVAAVYGVCFALKKAKFFDDRFIPLAAIVLGICFELLVYASTGAGNAAEFAMRGIISGMAAVFCANIIKQIGVDGN